MKRTYTVNEDAFAGVPQDPEANYWTGWLLADGNNTGRTMQCGCAPIDSPHLFSLLAFLGSNSPIRTDRMGYSYIHVHSKELARALAKLGVIPNKTAVARVRKFLIFDRDFWRGMIDGDGAVYVTTQQNRRGEARRVPHVAVCGTWHVCDAFIQFGNDLLRSYRLPAWKCRPHVDLRSPNHYRVEATGWFAWLLCQCLYGSGGPVLPRKFAMAQSIVHDPEFRGAWGHMENWPIIVRRVLGGPHRGTVRIPQGDIVAPGNIVRAVIRRRTARQPNVGSVGSTRNQTRQASGT